MPENFQTVSEGEFSEVAKIHIQFTSNSHLHPLHSIQQPTK